MLKAAVVNVVGQINLLQITVKPGYVGLVRIVSAADFRLAERSVNEIALRNKVCYKIAKRWVAGLHNFTV